MRCPLPHLPVPNNKKTAEAYIRACARWLQGGYHPDTPFEDYINYDTRKPTFGKRTAAKIQAMHDKACWFVDPYKVGMSEWRRMEKERLAEGDAIN